MLRWLGLPVEASSQATSIDQIIVLVHWLMLVMFAGWSVFLVYVLVRFRRGAHPAASYEGASGRWARLAGIGVVAAEVILLVFFSIPAWSSRVDASPSEQQATVVRVVAEQFAWNIQYPGPDGTFGRTRLELVRPENPLGLDISDPAAKDDVWTQNQLNLPVGRPVIVHLSSKDVIHSFGLPQMRVKQDAIPGSEQHLWFTPTKTGEWEIACSQLCGLGHYRMRGFYTIQTQADFDAWLASQPAGL
jgi:cytochrome c oxidase subunit II